MNNVAALESAHDPTVRQGTGILRLQGFITGLQGFIWAAYKMVSNLCPIMDVLRWLYPLIGNEMYQIISSVYPHYCLCVLFASSFVLFFSCFLVFFLPEISVSRL